MCLCELNTSLSNPKSTSESIYHKSFYLTKNFQYNLFYFLNIFVKINNCVIIVILYLFNKSKKLIHMFNMYKNKKFQWN